MHTYIAEWVKPKQVCRLKCVDASGKIHEWFVKQLSSDNLHEYDMMNSLAKYQQDYFDIMTRESSNKIKLTQSVCIPTFDLIRDPYIVHVLPGDEGKFSVALCECIPELSACESSCFLVTKSLVDDGYTLMADSYVSKIQFMELLKSLIDFYKRCRLTHTDLKPDNILIRCSSPTSIQLCLIDFEMAILDVSKTHFNHYLRYNYWVLDKSHAGSIFTSRQRFEFAIYFDLLRLLSACFWFYSTTHHLPDKINTHLLHSQSVFQDNGGAILNRSWYTAFRKNIQDVMSHG